jgi:hypothetical protein
LRVFPKPDCAPAAWRRRWGLLISCAWEDAPVPKAEPPRRRGSLPIVLFVLVAGAALAVLLQRSLAEQVGAVLANVWVSAVGAVAGILAAFFGH